MSTRPEKTFEHPNLVWLDDIRTDAMNWLDIVGSYDHALPKPNSAYNSSVSRAMRFLGDKIAEDDHHTAAILSALECKAQQATAESSWETDAEAQDSVRHTQLYDLARVMNGYAAVSAWAEVL